MTVGTIAAALGGTVIALGLIAIALDQMSMRSGEFHIKGPNEYCPGCDTLECERMTTAERDHIKRTTMIYDAVEQLTEQGFNREQKITDEYGCIGYLVSFVGQHYVLVAKEYAHKDKASFMARLVVQAPEEYDFIFYSKDDDSFTVFDGDYLRENADASHGESKIRDCSWREIPRGAGADLHDYVRGRDEPATIAGPNETLDRFTG